MDKLYKVSLYVSIGLASTTAFSANYLKSVSADKHVKIVQYDPNNVVILNGEYGYQTQVSFATNEVVQNVSLGDSMAWQTVPVANNLFIKPVAPSKTNMTVLTNLNSYNFELDSEKQNNVPTYKLQFIYKPGGYNSFGKSNNIATFDPEKLNWKYSFTGAYDLAPINAFDDGKFTYFKFRNSGSQQIPAIFIIDNKKQESLINYHMKGDYLVVNSVASQFILRDGAVVTKIYNEA